MHVFHDQIVLMNNLALNAFLFLFNFLTNKNKSMFLFLDKPNVEKEIKFHFMNTFLVLPNMQK